MTRQTNLYVSMLIFLTLAAAATIYPRYEWQARTIGKGRERIYIFDYTERNFAFSSKRKDSNSTYTWTRSLLVENLLLEYALALIIASLSYVAPPVVALLQQRTKKLKQ